MFFFQNTPPWHSNECIFDKYHFGTNSFGYNNNKVLHICNIFKIKVLFQGSALGETQAKKSL